MLHAGVVHSRGSEGVEADEEVAVRFTVPRRDAERALLVDTINRLADAGNEGER